MTKEEFLKNTNTWSKTVYIMRGLPGSGKSTIAKEIYKNPCGSSIYSADDFWIQLDGSYKFDASKVPQNHYECLKEFIYGNTDGLWTIVVDNTNTSLRELDTYAKIALAYGYKVVIVTCWCSIATSVKRNKHEVPEKVIRGMAEKLNYWRSALNLFAKQNDIDLVDIDTN